jgi:glucoamylase
LKRFGWWAFLNFLTLSFASEPPRSGQSDFTWATGTKDFFGTAWEAYDSMGTYSPFSPSAPISRVWFTGARGALTEISWPTIDRRQTRNTEFLVTDGKSFFFDEQKDGISEVEWIEDGVPAFQVTTRDKNGRFSLEKTFYASPNHDAVLIRVKFHKFSNGLKLYLLHSPAAGNTGWGDHGRAVLARNSKGQAEGLYAWQGKDAQAVSVSLPLKTAAVSFGGNTDGYSDLKADYKQDYFYDEAHDGHLVFLSEISTAESRDVENFTISIGFGSDPNQAMATAQEANSRADALLTSYRQDWYFYRSSLANLTLFPGGNPSLYYASIAVLKSLEDKTFAGAAVSGPGVPWGSMRKDGSSQYVPLSDDFWAGDFDHANRTESQKSGYQHVCIRDLYHSASALIGVGDLPSAVAMLRYMQRTQLGDRDGAWTYGRRVIARRGAWAQSTWANGEPDQKDLEMDEVAQPILLAYHLWKIRAVAVEEFWPMVRDAGLFLKEAGPWTAKDRWGESMGLSPHTIAFEISGLSGAAEMAEAMREFRMAELFRSTAAEWAKKLDAWTYTRKGSLGAGQYYLRAEASSDFDAPWDPDDEAWVKISNNGPKVLEKSVIDGGYFELLRLGIKNPLSPEIQSSLLESDRALSTALGPRTYRRYNYDRYGWDEESGESVDGGAWPILTAERGLAAWAMARAQSSDPRAQINALSPYLRTLETLATKSNFMPEQIRADSAGLGQITGAMSPWGRSHAEYLKLLRKRADINP